MNNSTKKPTSKTAPPRAKQKLNTSLAPLNIPNVPSVPPPHNSEAEQSILGAMLMDEAAIKHAAQTLSESDFYFTRHSTVFSEILALHKSGSAVDLVTITEQLRRHDQLDQINGEGNGPAYLTALIEACPTSANAPAYAAIVRDLSLKRRAAVMADKARSYAMNGVNAGVSLVELRRTLDELSASEREGHQPATMNAAELMALELPEPVWVVPQILPEGLGILAGNPKLGKSWLALNICLAVAHGGAALGTINVTRGDVLYLALEDTKRRLQSRLRQMMTHGQKAPERLHLATEWERLDEGGLPKIEQWLQGHPQARLVVVDTLQKVRSCRTRGGDLYAEDYASVSSLKALADTYGVAVVVIHHRRKGQGDDDLEAVSGTYGLTGAADSILSLKRERGRQDATLYVTGRDIDEQELALSWNADIGTWTIIGEAAEYRLSQERADVIATLQKAGRPMTPKEIFEAGTGASREAIRVLLFKMSNDGQITNHGGKYTPLNSTPTTPQNASLLPDSTDNISNSDNRSNNDNSGNRRSREAAARAGAEPYHAQRQAQSAPQSERESGASVIAVTAGMQEKGDLFDDNAPE